MISIRLLLNSNHVNALDLQIRIQTTLEEVAADKAEVTDAVETVEIKITDKVEVVEEILQIIADVADVADVADIVDLVEADIDQAIGVTDGTYIGLIRGSRRIRSIIPNQISMAFVSRRVI